MGEVEGRQRIIGEREREQRFGYFEIWFYCILGGRGCDLGNFEHDAYTDIQTEHSELLDIPNKVTYLILPYLSCLLV